MINIGIALMVMVMSVQCFSISYRLNGINRAFLETPISLFQVAIPIITNNDEYIAYFDKDELIENLTYYYDTNIRKYSNDYSLYYYFSNVGESSVCLSKICDAIEIKLTARIIFSTTYSKTLRFEIRRAN